MERVLLGTRTRVGTARVQHGGRSMPALAGASTQSDRPVPSGDWCPLPPAEADAAFEEWKREYGLDDHLSEPDIRVDNPAFGGGPLRRYWVKGTKLPPRSDWACDEDPCRILNVAAITGLSEGAGCDRGAGSESSPKLMTPCTSLKTAREEEPNGNWRQAAPPALAHRPAPDLSHSAAEQGQVSGVIPLGRLRHGGGIGGRLLIGEELHRHQRAR